VSERTYVVESDTSQAAALPGGTSQAAALPGGPLPQTPHSYRSDTHTPLPSLHPGQVLPIFPFAPVGITEIVLVRRPNLFYQISDPGFRSTLEVSSKFENELFVYYYWETITIHSQISHRLGFRV
jgi:hypothetical protein